jgi:hypothetical protein
MTPRIKLRWVAVVAGAIFLLAHLPSIAWFLDDIDAINFAMGLREYDIAKHQPHPPGYPIFILLGKIARTFVSVLPGADRPGATTEAGALAIWGILGGAISAVSLAALFTRVEDDQRRALAAMLLTLVCPLFWFTASRALSDMPGFACVLASQALAAAAFSRQRGWSARAREEGQGSIVAAEVVASGRLIVLSALIAGLAIGVRSQTFWLTLPVLAVVIVDRAGRAAAGALLGAGLSFGIGCLLWFVPMIVASGGPARYLHALSFQAGSDFGGVDMLVTSAQPVRRLVLNLLQTFVSPWVSLPLAAVILAFAAIGFLVMLRGSRRGLTLLGAMTVPYALFHLAFQENETVRYAMPLVPAVVYLAIRGVDGVLRRAMPLGAAALVTASAMIAVPALQAYAHETSPVFHLFADMRDAVRTGGAAAPAAIGMHRRVLTESKRAREWTAEAFPWPLLPAPVGHEWLELVKFWREGGDAQGDRPVWFVADPHRTDLALIDPESRRTARRYRWPLREPARDPLSRTLHRVFPIAFDDPALVGGARPDEMDWYVLDAPGWFLAEGWALTPETSGVAAADKKGPGDNQATGYVRRRPGAVQMMIGGRNLGKPSDPAVRFILALDGKTLETFEVAPSPGFFLRSLTLPEGALTGAGRWAEITVKAESANPRVVATGSAAPAGGGATVGGAVAGGAAGSAAQGLQPVAAAVEQFDLQPLDGVMVAYDAGWHEAEFDPMRGLSWRWASDAATLRVWSGGEGVGQDVEVTLRAESPRRYFDAAPKVILRAGDRTLATMTPEDDFELTARVPASALRASGGILTLTTDRVFVPAEVRRGSSDRRRLGLRIYDVSVTRPSTR